MKLTLSLLKEHLETVVDTAELSRRLAALVAIIVLSGLEFRVRLVLGRRAVAVRGYVGTRVLDYRDVASFDCDRVDTLVRSGRMRGYQLIFRPEGGQGALSFFVDDSAPLPAAMIDRLKRLPFVVAGALGAMDRGEP